MGDYVYSLRKRRVPVQIEGQRVMCNVMDFAYKTGAEFDPTYRSQVIRVEAWAERALAAYPSPTVVWGGGEEGSPVFADVDMPVCHDDMRPGRLLGWIRREGRARILVPAH